MKLAVFDIDGTLTQPYRGEDAAFIEGLEVSFGFTDVDADWTTYPHVTDTGIVTSLCLDRWNRPPSSTEMTRFQEAYTHSFAERAGPNEGKEIAGARNFIAALRMEPDWRLAVATGNCVRMTELKLTRGEIPCLDLPTATADDAISRAELVRLAMERAQMQYDVRAFEHVVSIGDAPWDLRTARELDLPFVVVGSRCGEAPDGHMIADYLDRASVMKALTEAARW